MAPPKTYVSADRFLSDSWKLASMVRKSGWRPDVLLALWRGGAGAGIAVHEFFKATGWDVRHYPLKCASYSGICGEPSDVVFTLGAETFALIAPGENVLVVDDVLDTGRTAATLKERIAERGAEARIATVYRKPSPDASRIEADYCARDLGGDWIVFPHEIEGLAKEEILEKDPELARLLER